MDYFYHGGCRDSGLFVDHGGLLFNSGKPPNRSGKKPRWISSPSYNSDSRVDEAHRIIHKYKETPVKAISPLKDQIESKERIDFLFLMNMFELMAIGLTHDIYDVQMIKDAFGADLRQIYVDAQKGNLIDAVRAETPDLPDFLSEYEKFIRRLNLPQANRAAAAIRSPIRAKPRAPNLGDR